MSRMEGHYCINTGVSVDVPAEIITYWQSTGALPAELVTGHHLIDMEHRFLIAAISNLRQVCDVQPGKSNCCGCTPAHRQDCEKQLVSMLGDIFSFILGHFLTEERVMRDSLLLMVDRDVCEAHMEDHAAISRAVQQIASALDRMHVVSRIGELDALLARWVTNHIALHDMLLARWVARDDSLVQLR